MNINWKTRFTSKTFWAAVASTIVLFSQQLGLKVFPSNWSDILNTVLSLLTILGIIVDPSTPGIGDGEKLGAVLVNEGESVSEETKGA